MSEDVSDLQRKIIAQIMGTGRRPSAIASLLRRRHVECDQNEVVQALVDLERRGLAERTTAKAWAARGNAESYLE